MKYDLQNENTRRFSLEFYVSNFANDDNGGRLNLV